MCFSDRILNIKPSATRAMADKAQQLKEQGKKITSLTTGEPDFASPKAALEYASKAMADGKTKYTETAGVKELRRAVVEYYANRHGVEYAEKEVLTGSGAKPLLYEALGALVNPGDEVIIPTPAWVSYVEQVHAFDGKAVLVAPPEGQFEPDLKALEKAVTPRTKALMINNPHNPTGAVFSPKLMEGLCRLAMKHNFLLINDEIYERLTYGVRYTNPLAAVPEAKSHVLTINGMSKTYAMTGWRIGFALGPQSIIAKMSVLQGHTTSCACSISQWASVGAILHGQDDAERMVAEYGERRDYICGEFETMPGIRAAKPQGAFYAWLDVRGCYGKKHNGALISDDNSFCELLLERGLVALVPGTAFMAPGFARMSYASSMDTLRAGMQGMREFLNALQ